MCVVEITLANNQNQSNTIMTKNDEKQRIDDYDNNVFSALGSAKTNLMIPHISNTIHIMLIYGRITVVTNYFLHTEPQNTTYLTRKYHLFRIFCEI